MEFMIMQDHETRVTVNRQNAVHSTGPRSSSGQPRSAKNAIKHGLTSANPVIAEEDAAQWLKCLHGVQESVNPKNFLEGEIARAMSYLVWRQERQWQFELGMTKKVVEEHLRFDKRGPDIIDLRECCESQEFFLKDWPRKVRLLRCVLNKKDKDCVSSNEAASLFAALVDLIDHQLLRDHLDSSELLVKAGYRARLKEGEELKDDILYERIRWNRGKLNRGLQFIAKSVGLSLAELIDSLELFVVKQMSKCMRKPRSDDKELTRME